MTATFRKSFARDLKTIRDPSILDHVRRVIEQVEAASTLRDLGDFQRLSGAESHYRLNVGDYRLAVVFDGKDIEFVRCVHRSELHRIPA
jgi:mRNA interferase RelE/StbE